MFKIFFNPVGIRFFDTFVVVFLFWWREGLSLGQLLSSENWRPPCEMSCVRQEDVGRDNDLHSTVANRIVELAKHDQKKLVAVRQSGVAVIAVKSLSSASSSLPFTSLYVISANK